MKKRGPRISWGGEQGIKIHRGFRTQGRTNNTLLFIIDWLMLRSWKYLISTMGGTLYPWSGIFWHNFEGQDQRICYVYGATSSFSGLATEGYFWMSILISFGPCWIIWTSKNITSHDITLGKLCVGNDDFNSLWQLLFTLWLEDNGVAGAKESTWPPKVRKVEDGINMY